MTGMTKDYAIAILRRMQEPDPFEPQINEAAFDALEMAIQALEDKEIPNYGDADEIIEFLRQTQNMYDEDSHNYKICEDIMQYIKGVEKAALKLAYVHERIDLYCDRTDLHDESYWMQYLLDPDWEDNDIGWDGNENE